MRNLTKCSLAKLEKIYYFYDSNLSSYKRLNILILLSLLSIQWIIKQVVTTSYFKMKHFLDRVHNTLMELNLDNKITSFYVNVHVLLHMTTNRTIWFEQQYWLLYRKNSIFCWAIKRKTERQYFNMCTFITQLMLYKQTNNRMCNFFFLSR